jgi:hypothetical protein
MFERTDPAGRTDRVVWTLAASAAAICYTTATTPWLATVPLAAATAIGLLARLGRYGQARIGSLEDPASLGDRELRRQYIAGDLTREEYERAREILDEDGTADAAETRHRDQAATEVADD